MRAFSALIAFLLPLASSADVTIEFANGPAGSFRFENVFDSPLRNTYKAKALSLIHPEILSATSSLTKDGKKSIKVELRVTDRTIVPEAALNNTLWLAQDSKALLSPLFTPSESSDAQKFRYFRIPKNSQIILTATDKDAEALMPLVAAGDDHVVSFRILGFIEGSDKRGPRITLSVDKPMR